MFKNKKRMVINMRCGIFFDRYEKELHIYKIWDDGSRKKIIRLYEKHNFVHIDLRADNFKYFIGFNETYELMEQNMAGVDLNVIYHDMLDAGMIELEE